MDVYEDRRIGELHDKTDGRRMEGWTALMKLNDSRMDAQMGGRVDKEWMNRWVCC